MPGPWTYANDADVASLARAQLEQANELVEVMEAGRRRVVAALVGMWPTAAWRAAGLRSATDWLVTSPGLSRGEARRLVSIAELCARDQALADAVADGRLSLGRAGVLARAVIDERAPWLTDQAVANFVQLASSTSDDEEFSVAVRWWRECVDQELAPRTVGPHKLQLSPRLFGGGDIIGSLAPTAFANVSAAVDAFTQDPDPADAPYRRTFHERQADALDDIAVFARTHDPDGDVGSGVDGLDDDIDDDLDDGLGAEFEQARAEDTFDGWMPTDDLDEALDPDNENLDPLGRLRCRIQRSVGQQRRRERRRVKARSGTRVNLHIDLETLASLRGLDDFDGLILRGEGWNAARAAAEELLCDTSLVTTLFDGSGRVLDVNDDAERFSTRQRRAIAARDRCCVFPGCTRPPKHCDIHHLHERHHGGPTKVDNGALLCRFHHRLLHQHRWTLSQDPDGTWTATDPHGVKWKGRRTTHQNAA